MNVKTVTLVAVVLLGLLTGCGSESSGTTKSATATVPTTVSPADLERSGEFWMTLSPDLRDDLVEAAKERRAEELPDAAASLRAADRASLVSEIEKHFSNAGNREDAIYSAYLEATQRLAMDSLNQALDGMERLCEGDPRPAQC